jgi:hypothetical protein
MSTQVLQADVSVLANGFDAVLVPTDEVDGQCMVDGVSSSDPAVDVVGASANGLDAIGDTITAGSVLYVTVKNRTPSPVSLSVRVALTKVEALPTE